MIGELLGNYQITGQLGEGGMGVVYTASHKMLGSKAAVKLLLPELSTNQQIVERFFNEAKAAALINHPGLITIFDFGYHEGGSAYIVMEFLEGESLAATIKREAPLPPEKIVEFARQACLALGAAHEARIVHRDLKPDNLFVVPDPALPMGFRIKVLDFGIAKLSGDMNSSVKTRTGSVMGTPVYMAPEQCRGAGKVDYRADIYAMGCILFEMLCGRPPFLGEGMGEILGKHQFQAAPRATDILPSAHTGLTKVIAKSLAKEPNDRQQSMSELADELAAALGQEAMPHRAPSAQPRDDLALAKTQASSTTLGGAVHARSEMNEASGGSKWPLALGALALAGIGTVAFVSLQGSADKGESNGHQAQAGVVYDAAPEPEPAAMDAAAIAQVTEPDAQVDVTPVAEAPAIFSHTVSSTPAGAEVFRELDKVRVGKTPYTFERPSTEGELVFVLTLDGYKSKTVSVDLSRSQELEVKLSKQRSARPSRPSRPEGKALDPFATP